MSDLLHAVNFLEIQNAKDGNRNEARLRDLEGKAHYLSKKTGSDPLSWYEFTQEVPPEKPRYMQNASIGAVIGMALGVGATLIIPPLAAATVPALLTGGVVGGLVGGYHATENTSRAKQVDAYEQYLTQFEQTKGHGLGVRHDGLMQEFERIAAAENRFASQIKKEREAEKAKDCGCKSH
jgi:hypothetical protein